MTRNSLVWSPILLQRKIPMAWGTTTDKVTTEINPFLYARETKNLTNLGIGIIKKTTFFVRIFDTMSSSHFSSISYFLG